MEKLLDLKHWAFAIMLIFTAKLAFLVTCTWLDFACLIASVGMYAYATFIGNAPKTEALEEIETLQSALMAMRNEYSGGYAVLHNQVEDLKKVTEEAKKLMSQTNIQAAFVPRRARGE